MQFIHVSELYETVATATILILLITQILAGYNQLWGFITQLRTSNRDQQLKWIKEEGNKEDKQKDEAQKSAIESLKKQMSQFENKGQQQNQEQSKNKQEEQKSSINNLLGELDPSKKSVLLFYIEFNNFMSEHVAIIMSILVLGILTKSTWVFSLACFFCYLFSSLIFDFLHLEQRLKQEYKRGIILRRIVKILSGCIIIAIFIDYWASTEFSA